MKLSVVIPTKDRHESLSRLLASLASQSCKPQQIVIVTGSSDKEDIVEVISQYPGIEASVIESQASVCIQRNKGIDLSDGDHLFLCDDDIELPSNYLQEITEYIQSSHAGAVSGLVIQPDDAGHWRSQYPPSRLSGLLWRFLFQLSVWGEVDQIKTNVLGRVFLSSLKSFYRWRANTFTWAGWPLITDFSGPVFHTTIYNLGACVVRRDWLIDSRFDETLDAHGIGDNYGVAIGFPSLQAIHVLTRVKAHHHLEQSNRLDLSISYFRRIVALDYFLKLSKRFGITNRFMLRWSIVGSLIASCVRRDWLRLRVNKNLLYTLCLGANPYFVARLENRRIVEIANSIIESR